MPFQDRDTQGEGHVTTEGEIRVMQLQAKEGQGLAATIEARKKTPKKQKTRKEGFSPTGSGGAWSF